MPNDNCLDNVLREDNSFTLFGRVFNICVFSRLSKVTNE